MNSTALKRMEWDGWMDCSNYNFFLLYLQIIIFVQKNTKVIKNKA